jgi:hypothetical protein
MKKYLVEFIGMFLFVLVVGMVVIDPGIGSFAPIAIGVHTYERIGRPRGQFFHMNWTGKGGAISSSTYNV